MRDPRTGPRRVLAYARVSSIDQEQHGTSLDAQRDELERYCKARGYPKPVLRIEAESGGGTGEARLEQTLLMRDIAPGDLVLVTKQDRWSRDTLHYLHSIDEILAKGASFFSLAEQFDPSTPAGRMVSTVMAATAEHERARIRERTVVSRQRLRGKGYWVEGLPPVGYRRDDFARKLVPHETRAPIIARMFALCVAGRTTRQIEDDLRAEFGDVPGLDGAAIGRRLRDRRYLGEMATEGTKLVKRAGGIATWIAAHPPLVDVATWRRAQTALDERRRGGRSPSGESRTANYLVRHLVRCGSCGAVLSSHSPGPTSSVTHGGYYQCPRRLREPGACNGPRAKHEDVDALVDELAAAHLDTLAERLAKPAAARKGAPDFAATRAKLERRRANIVEAIADGTVSRDVARAKLVAIEDAIVDADRREAAWSAQDEQHRPDARRAMLRDVKALRKAWRALPVASKQVALRAMIDVATIDRKPGATLWQRGAWSLTIKWRN